MGLAGPLIESVGQADRFVCRMSTHHFRLFAPAAQVLSESTNFVGDVTNIAGQV
jgi:hypothetical protein